MDSEKQKNDFGLSNDSRKNHDFSYEKKVIVNDFKGVLGQKAVKEQLRSAILMKRNVIIVGSPGIGKTTLVKSLAGMLPNRLDDEGNSVKVPFVRVQGSPDLTAEDLIGDIDPVKALEHGPLSLEAFTPGKLFKADKGILFFDEVNRCSEKLQNALLQALEEKKVTIGSYDVDLNADFIFVGTMNPEETSTEPLSDVFLDRFDLIYMDAPESLDLERDIVVSKAKSLVEFPEHLLLPVLNFVRDLRASDDLEKKPSVRASIGIFERAQANAFLKGKNVVELDDIKLALISVLSHRIRLKPSLKFLKKTSDYIKENFSDYCEKHDLGKGGSP